MELPSAHVAQAVFDRVVLGGAGSRDRAAQLQAVMSALQAGFNTPPVQLPFTGRCVRGTGLQQQP